MTLTACSGHVKEVDEYINIKDEVILEIGKKIEANPTEAGVDEARKVFESRKAELKAKREALRDKKIGSDQLKMMLDSSVNNDEMFNAIRKNFGTDIAADQKFVKLVNDFNAVFK